MPSTFILLSSLVWLHEILHDASSNGSKSVFIVFQIQANRATICTCTPRFFKSFHNFSRTKTSKIWTNLDRIFKIMPRFLQKHKHQINSKFNTCVVTIPSSSNSHMILQTNKNYFGLYYSQHAFPFSYYIIIWNTLIYMFPKIWQYVTTFHFKPLKKIFWRRVNFLTHSKHQWTSYTHFRCVFYVFSF